jgi:hypothetical protein
MISHVPSIIYGHAQVETALPSFCKDGTVSARNRRISYHVKHINSYIYKKTTGYTGIFPIRWFLILCMVIGRIQGFRSIYFAVSLVRDFKETITVISTTIPAPSAWYRLKGTDSQITEETIAETGSVQDSRLASCGAMWRRLPMYR